MVSRTQDEKGKNGRGRGARVWKKIATQGWVEELNVKGRLKKKNWRKKRATQVSMANPVFIYACPISFSPTRLALTILRRPCPSYRDSFRSALHPVAERLGGYSSYCPSEAHARRPRTSHSRAQIGLTRTKGMVEREVERKSGSGGNNWCKKGVGLDRSSCLCVPLRTCEERRRCQRRQGDCIAESQL